MRGIEKLMGAKFSDRLPTNGQRENLVFSQVSSNVSDPLSSQSAADFRSAMRQLAATVSLVTTNAGGVFHGMAATSVTSLSASPPSVLVCVNKDASMHGPTLQSARFCINMLRGEQIDICEHFTSQKGQRRFEVGDWKVGPLDLPYVAGAAAVLFCRLETHIVYATHTIFIGQISDIYVDPVADPLLYHAGRTGRFQPHGGRA